jgi:hypothetical protein
MDSAASKHDRVRHVRSSKLHDSLSFGHWPRSLIVLEYACIVG